MDHFRGCSETAEGIVRRRKDQLRQALNEAVQLPHKTQGGFETRTFRPGLIPVFQRVLVRLKANHTLQLNFRNIIKAQLVNRLLAKLRQNIGNVIGKNLVGGQNRYVLRREPVFEPVEQKSNPVERNGRLAGAGHPLNEQYIGLFVSDDLVLLLLDGGDNGFHLFIRGPGKFPLQHIVLDIA